MDKKNITIIIGVVIVLAVVLGVGIYLLVKQAPKIESLTKDDDSKYVNNIINFHQNPHLLKTNLS